MASIPDDRFRIGAVARLTGISPDTLRVWERRYGIVTPQRSAGSSRLYDEADVEKLCLVKTLVDHGHGIGTLAGLSASQLRERLELKHRLRPGAIPRVTVGVLGARFMSWIRQNIELSDVDVLVAEPEPEEFIGKARALNPTLLVLEFPTLHAETVSEIGALLSDLDRQQAIVVYQYGNRTCINRLRQQGLRLLTFPPDAAQFTELCIELAGRPSGIPSTSSGTGPIPARRYSDEALMRFARSSGPIRCGCPQHLAKIIMSLAAFEQYCVECEQRNEEDAAVHAYLHRRTVEARDSMEQALTRLAEADGVEVE